MCLFFVISSSLFSLLSLSLSRETSLCAMKTAIMSLGGSATKRLRLPPCMSSTKDNGDSLPLRGAPRQRRSSVSPSSLGLIVSLGGSSTKQLRLSPWLSSTKENIDSLSLCGSLRRRRSYVSLLGSILSLGGSLRRRGSSPLVGLLKSKGKASVSCS